jgi:hypothetical protein
MRIRTETIIERRTLATVAADMNETEPTLIPGLGSSSCSSSGAGR